MRLKKYEKKKFNFEEEKKNKNISLSIRKQKQSLSLSPEPLLTCLAGVFDLGEGGGAVVACEGESSQVGVGCGRC